MEILLRWYNRRASDPQKLKQGSNILPLLDLVRWISALEVVFYHVRHELFVDFNSLSHSSAAIKAFFFLTSFGDQAVAVFFALSGYLVGGSCIRKMRRGDFKWSEYFVDRFSRIYLVLVPVLVLTVLIGLYVGRPSDYRLIACNFFSLQDNVCDAPAANNALWSLGCEWFYYFSFPLLLLCVRWRRTHPVIAAVIVASIGFYSFHFDRVSLIGQIVWILGAYAAVTEFKVPSIILLAGALCFAAAGQVIAKNSVWDFLFFGVGACLLFRIETRVTRWPDFLLRLNTALSAFSYSLYLVHVPIMYLLIRFLVEGKMLSTIDRGSMVMFFEIVAACVLCAYLLALLTERNTGLFRKNLSGLLGRLR